MIEKTLSSELEVKQEFNKVGVVVFIYNREGKVLVLSENTGKTQTGKNAGDYSVLCETGENGEMWQHTVIRGLEEELGIPRDEQSILFEVGNNCYLGETTFVKGVLARVVILHYTGSLDRFSPGMNLGEVSVVGWKNLNQLLGDPLRSGVRKVLEEGINQGLLNQPIGESEMWPLSLGYLKIAGAV